MKYSFDFRPEINTTLNVEPEFIKPLLTDGYTIIDRTPTGFVLRKPSGGTITEYSDDELSKRVCHPREFIRRHYRKNDVTREDFARLVLDLQNKKVSFDEIFKYNK